ncbi:MAG: hypothetical protein KDH97_20455, partial [Calditrichaeota bacterium]|nr:hypothetical protein [Calditrichota bacterium]
LCVRAELWRRIGGFDARYAPAYYEDVDLAFSARALGFRVLYQPLYTVVGALTTVTVGNLAHLIFPGASHAG